MLFKSIIYASHIWGMPKMCLRRTEKHMWPYINKLITLLVILILNVYPLSSHTNLQINPTQALRPPAQQNGSIDGEFSFEADPTPRLGQQADKIPGKTTYVYSDSGVVYVRDTGEDGEEVGPETLLPAEFWTSSNVPSGTIYAQDQERIAASPAGFEGTPLKSIESQLKVLVTHSLQKSLNWRGFETEDQLRRNKVIEINTDLFPDFDPEQDTPERRLVEGILRTLAQKMLRHQKDKRFTGRLYIDFVSRIGPLGETKKNASIRLFTEQPEAVAGLPQFRRYQLEEMLFSAEIGEADRLTITHKGDSAEFKNPFFMLQTPVMVGKMVEVYPWDSLMDLWVGILSIDRTVPLDKDSEAYKAIEALYKDLLTILKVEGKDRIIENLGNILPKLLSNDPKAYAEAASEIILPPVREVDLEAIDDIIKIMIDVTRYA